MIGSSHSGGRGTWGEIGDEHVGEDGARFGKVEGCDRGVHLIETFATTQKLGIDRANLVEHLLELAVVGEKLGHLRIRAIRHIAEPRAFPASSNFGHIPLPPPSPSPLALTAGPSPALFRLHERPPHNLS